MTTLNSNIMQKITRLSLAIILLSLATSCGNTSKKEKKISFTPFAERTSGFTQATDIITKAKSGLKDFSLGSYKTVVLELGN